MKAYTEAGGQFFVVEEQVDNRVEGGDFEAVKSVSQMDQQKIGKGKDAEDELDPAILRVCGKCQLRLCDCVYV